MKKCINFFIILLLGILFSCSFEIPKKISVVSDAEYGFTVGKFSKSLSDYISVAKITEQINSSNSSNNIKVYDYNPKGNTIQQFLVDLPVREIPVDVSQYLENLDFSTDGSGEISFEQTIEVPDLRNLSQTSTLHFPEIKDQFVGTEYPLGILKLPEVSIPYREELLTSADATYINFIVTEPTFESITFYKGGINLDIAKTEGDSPSSSDYSSDYTFALCENGQIISTVKNVNLANVPAASSLRLFFDLRGKDLSQSVRIIVYGDVANGDPAYYAKYSFTASFSDDTAFSKITGLSGDFDSGETINDTIQIATDDVFLECKIEEGSLLINAPAPDGWTGVTASISNTDISGALEFPAGNDFQDSDEAGYFIYKSRDLKDAVYTKGDISFSGTISFNFSNATLVFPNGVQPSVQLNTLCQIGKVDYIKVDLATKADLLSYEKEITFPDEVKNYVSQMKLVNSGLEITYSDNLPVAGTGDNTIGLDVESLLLEIDDSSKEIEPSRQNVTLSYMSPLDEIITVTPSTDNLDFKFSLNLPKESGDDTYVAVLKKVELAETYNISFTAKPVFDWEEVVLKVESLGSQEGEVSFGMSFNDMFSSLEDALGDDSDFFNNIYPEKLPLYLYYSKPGLDALEDINFEGTIDLKVGSKTEHLLESSNVFKSVSLESLDIDENGSVTTVLAAQNASANIDLASLIENASDKAGEISVNYNLSLAGLDSEGLTVTKEDFEELKNGSSAGSISINARMIIPLSIKLDDGTGDSGVTEIDIFKLAKLDPSDDIFKRNKETDIDDFEKYIDLVDYAKIVYSIDNGLFNYSERDREGKLNFETGISGLINESYQLGMSSDEISIESDDVKTMLRTYPFTPSLKAVLPNGTLSVPRDAEFAIGLSIIVKTDGKVDVWEK